MCQSISSWVCCAPLCICLCFGVCLCEIKSECSEIESLLKDGMGLRMKDYWGSLLRGGSWKTNTYLTCGVVKRGWCFWRGVDTQMHTKKLDTFLHKTRIKVLRLIIKCGMIAHSAEETRQQNEQWGWGLETTEKWERGGGSGQKLKEGGGGGGGGGSRQYRRGSL